MPPKTTMTPEEVAKDRPMVANARRREVPKWLLFRGNPGSNRDLSNCGTLADVKKPMLSKLVLPGEARTHKPTWTS